MAPRTQEEIAERLRQKFAPRLSEAFAKEDRADILAALREAADAATHDLFALTKHRDKHTHGPDCIKAIADAARQEEREALRKALGRWRQIWGSVEGAEIGVGVISAWLDAREKGRS